LYVKLDSGAVARVDPHTSAVAATVPIGGSVCQGIGVGFGSVWSCKDSNIVRIDPQRDAVVATIDIAKTAEQGHLVTGFGRVWVIVDDGRSIVGIDPATNRPDPPIAVPIRATELAIDGAHLWAASAVDHGIVRVDAAARKVDGRADGLGSVIALVSNGSAVFAATPDAVTRIDADTLAEIGTLAVAPGADGGLTLVGSEVWVHRPGALLRVPSNGGEPVVVPGGTSAASGGDVLFAFGAVWASADDDDVVLRVRP
jgi:hypothetical protein